MMIHNLVQMDLYLDSLSDDQISKHRDKRESNKCAIQ